VDLPKVAQGLLCLKLDQEENVFLGCPQGGVDRHEVGHGFPVSVALWGEAMMMMMMLCLFKEFSKES
jgi:hypothetical protein